MNKFHFKVNDNNSLKFRGILHDICNVFDNEYDILTYLLSMFDIKEEFNENDWDILTGMGIRTGIVQLRPNENWNYQKIFMKDI